MTATRHYSSTVQLSVLRAIRAAQRAGDMFGLLMASGIAVWFGFQSFVNIGIMPVTGLPSRSSPAAAQPSSPT